LKNLVCREATESPDYVNRWVSDGLNAAAHHRNETLTQGWIDFSLHFGPNDFYGELLEHRCGCATSGEDRRSSRIGSRPGPLCWWREYFRIVT
jgi:hypothetical protein